MKIKRNSRHIRYLENRFPWINDQTVGIYLKDVQNIESKRIKSAVFWINEHLLIRIYLKNKN